MIYFKRSSSMFFEIFFGGLFALFATGLASCSPESSFENQSTHALATEAEVIQEQILETSTTGFSRGDSPFLIEPSAALLKVGKFSGKLKCGSYVPNNGVTTTGASTFDYTWITVDGGTCSGTYANTSGTYIGLEADLVLSGLPNTLFRSVNYSFDFNVLQKPNVTINEYSYTVSKTGTASWGQNCYSIYNATSILTSTKTVQLGFMQGNGTYSYVYESYYGNHTVATLAYNVNGLRDTSKELSISSELSYSTYSRQLQKYFASQLSLTGYPSQSGSESAYYYITYGPVAFGTGVMGAPFTCYIETDYLKSVTFEH